jgi:hypothetical protein
MSGLRAVGVGVPGSLLQSTSGGTRSKRARTVDELDEDEAFKVLLISHVIFLCVIFSIM